MAVLADARRRGFLGTGSLEGHIAHARAYLRHGRMVEGMVPSLDLGSGGGVPGLVLAFHQPGSAWVLLDANSSKTAFLSAAVTSLGMGDRVSVVTARAEELGHDPAHRGRYACVVARAFGPPAVVAECAAPLLQIDASLLVSEPPDDRDRWPAAGLAQLGLVLAERAGESPRIAMLRQRSVCSPRFPRRVGIPAKRPLW